MEFWGDEVEEIRSFAVADQRTLEPASRLWAPPCRELLLTDEVRARARSSARSTPSWPRSSRSSPTATPSRAWSRSPRCSSTTWRCSSTCCPTQTHVLVLDPERARSRAHDLVATSEEFLEASWAAAAGGGQAPIDLGEASYHSLADVRAISLAQGKAWWSVSPFGLDPDAGAVVGRSRCATRSARSCPPAWTPRPAPSSPGRCRCGRSRPTAATWSAAVTDIKAWLGNDSRVVLVHEGHGPAQRMVEVLKEHDVPVRYVESLDDRARAGPGARHHRHARARLRRRRRSAWRCSPATT